MPSSAELTEKAIFSFIKVQNRMIIAREEKAVRLYKDLKDEYIALKALLTSLGVNVVELDIIKE